mmetsp:Transcript_4254/g.8143  ORF Transcript_4254/g.8143 Transcript_4254/m.8143 type:complete len:522 (+) Transcript_4254:151-1716(+)|eukprot:CAMPEP_0176497386 /NCGR_PEP_ID=MMETSP0200_2-20121128/11696_1 /TAXON_ID=947934 /ORGANISM="Chaetoceros sp., Strain GSL56" /LENGTH=521 /DNA_ID=CAMNT_0017895395 /DNA_START=80 /DNA_END=1645 /DNA_ORIENTATION=-
MPLSFQGKDSLLTLQDSNEEETVFSPLNSSLSYSATNTSLEVAPTKDVYNIQNSLKHRKNYGSPVGNDINTRHVSGKEIDIKHTQFALSAGMMLGIRECVGGMSSVSDDADFDSTRPMILEEECSRVEKVKIPAGAYFISSHMASLPYRYKFKAYAPHIFSKIRDFAGVEKQRFLHSICGNDSFIEFVSNAKSGQFFFYSHDGRYMIKTQTQEEKNFLRHILPHYFLHLKENPHSFITHFYGMYRVKIPDLGKSVHFVIMKSVFNTEKEIHKIWDLKGSTLGRRAKRGDGVRKDLDFVDEGRKLKVKPLVKAAIMEQLEKDAKFLAKMHIMDYSLLLGVHLCTQADEQSEKNRLNGDDAIMSNTPMRRQHKQEIRENGGKFGIVKQFFESAKDVLGILPEEERTQQSDDDTDSDRDEKGSSYLDPEEARTILSTHYFCQMTNLEKNPYTSRDDLGIESMWGASKELYFAGIIDILQLYNTRKWGETIFRKAVGNNEKAISCIHPEAYARRFVEFIGSLIEE